MAESMWIDLGAELERDKQQQRAVDRYRAMNRGGVRPLDLNRPASAIVPSYAPGFNRRYSKPYVPRTPGGNIVSERKYFDSQYGTTINTMTTSWANSEADPATVNCLFAPTQGNDINNREGRKVKVHNIKINGYVRVYAQINQTAPDDGAIIRLVLVTDKQTNASQLNAEDVLSSGSASDGMISCFMNNAFFGRFNILKDKTLTMNPTTIAWDGTNMEQQGSIMKFKIKHQFKTPLVVNFNSTNGGTVADIIDNSFHFLAACNIGNNALNPNIIYRSRVSFSD